MGQIMLLNHVSQSQMNLALRSPLYYPGEKLSFNHQILDKLNNKISTSYTWKMSINVFANVQDFESMSCSKRIDGLSESMNEPKCVDCHETIHLQYLLDPFGILLFWFLCITISNLEGNGRRSIQF